MGSEDDLPEDDEASRRREEGCRREEAIRSLLKQHDDKRLSIGAVDEIALDFGGTVIERLDGAAPAAADEDNGEDEAPVAGPIAIAVDVNETEASSTDNPVS